MAPTNQSRRLEYPPSASPSQEHEEEEEELEESLVQKSVQEESEEENEITRKSPRVSKVSQMSQHQSSDESSEEADEEEGFGTDNDNTQHSPTASIYIVKTGNNNHIMELKKPTTKRALILGEERKDTPKKTKLAKDHSQEDRVGTPKNARSASGKVWNSDDVITILEGMIDYRNQKGAEPHADMGAFLEFMKGRFGFEVTKTQLYEKVRSLKKKFVANLRKGESFVPTQPHDIECFKLSKNIWGSNYVAGGVRNSDSNPNDRVVANGVDHTDHVKIVDGEWVTKKSAIGKSSEGKRKEKVEKKKNMDNGQNIVEKEGEPVTHEDFMKDNEDIVGNYETVVEKEAELETDEDVMKDKEDVVKDYTIVVEKEAEPGTDEDVMKDNEDVMDDENGGSDINNCVNNNAVEYSAHNISCKYPNLIASLSFDMPESRRKLMVEGICLVDNGKARELDVCWQELRIKEAEFYRRRMELMAEQSRLVVDALKKNK